MNDKISDLIYIVRSLCESLRDRPEILDLDDELKELVDDTESCLDEVADLEEDLEETDNE